MMDFNIDMFTIVAAIMVLCVGAIVIGMLIAEFESIDKHHDKHLHGH